MPSLRLPQRGTKAFTMLELIVVIVILGILAAIAIPTFKKVIERSKKGSLDATLSAVDRDARALAGFDAAAVTEDHLRTAAGEAASAGTYVHDGATLVQLTKDGLCRQLNVVQGSAGTLSDCGVLVVAPGAPTAVTATAGDASATVSFTPPTSDGGSPISTYTVTSNPGNVTATGASSPLTVSGLTNGTSYTFTVTATNAAGKTSEPSAPSNAVTPATVSTGAVSGVMQFGTSQNERAETTAVALDGTTYVGGYTYGALGGAAAGYEDAFVRAYNPDRTVKWTQQFGTASHDLVYGVAVAGDDTLYVTGTTYASLDGTHHGLYDVFVRAYAPDGTLLWKRQFGTSGSDFAMGVAAAPGGGAYVVGKTDGALGGAALGGYDTFVLALGTDGVTKWTRQFGTPYGDDGQDIETAADGTVYVVGSANGTFDGTPQFGGMDVYLRAYTPDGTVKWTRQTGTDSTDQANGVGVGPDGSVYVAGLTGGNFYGTNAGSWDAFVQAYAPDGSLRWGRQHGTADDDRNLGADVGDDNNVFVTGYTGYDMSTRSYTPTGELRWETLVSGTTSSGGATSEAGHDVAAGPDGSAYVAGYTDGKVGETHHGLQDALLLKLQ